MQSRPNTPASITPASSGSSGNIILGLFGTPFALIGTFVFFASIRDAFRGRKDAAVGIIVGGIFMAVGCGIIYAAFAVSRTVRSKTNLQNQFPDEPWRWNKAWANGVIPDDSGSSMAFMWFFALLWNAISFPTFFLALGKGDAGKAIWLVLLFPLIGMGLLSVALYVTAQRWKYGRCELQLETLPGRIGGWIGGTIRTATVIDVSTGGMKIALKCINRVTTGSGKNSNTYENVLWQQQQTLSGKLPRLGTGLGLPVAFQIPPDCAQTHDDSRNAILWRIVATASEPGIDFKTTFIVPVFPVDAPEQSIPAADAIAAKFRQPEPEMARPHDARIGFEKDTAGRELFDFPPGRNLTSAMFLTLFALIFGGVGAAVMHANGPWLFGIPFEVVGVFLAIGASVTLLKGRTIHVLQDAVELRWRMLGFSGGRSISRSTISSVKYRSNSSVGNTSYYQVMLVTTASGDIAVASGLLVDDAKWIAEELGKTLGVETSAESMDDIRQKWAKRLNS